MPLLWLSLAFIAGIIVADNVDVPVKTWLIFAGMAAGYAAQVFLPAQELPVALTAGIAACATVGLGKPIAAFLILVFLIGSGTLGPLCVGVAIGMLASRYCPRPAH